jgi:hypothetical protein
LWINEQGILIEDVIDEPPEKFWKGGKCDLPLGPIRLWPRAFELYGWDVMTSVLIHEFGHIKLWAAEQIYKNEEGERKANRYGFCGMKAELVPKNYWLYREFFILSTLTPGNWTESQCREQYQNWIKWMRAAPSRDYW